MPKGQERKRNHNSRAAAKLVRYRMLDWCTVILIVKIYYSEAGCGVHTHSFNIPPPTHTQTHSHAQKHILSLISSIAHTASHSLHTDIQAIQTPYAYTTQLLELDRCRRQVPENLPTSLKHILTPAIIEVWEKELVGHPDPQFARYILQGLSQGFCIGFQHGSSRHQQAVSNMAVQTRRWCLSILGKNWQRVD